MYNNLWKLFLNKHYLLNSGWQTGKSLAGRRQRSSERSRGHSRSIESISHTCRDRLFPNLAHSVTDSIQLEHRERLRSTPQALFQSPKQTTLKHKVFKIFGKSWSWKTSKSCLHCSSVHTHASTDSGKRVSQETPANQDERQIYSPCT